MIRKIPVKKIGMTSAFDGAGTTVPVTLLEPIPGVITEIKRPEKHGYSAIQVAFGEVPEKRINKPLKGVLQKAGVEENYAHFYEVRMTPEEIEGLTVGQAVDPSEFVGNWASVVAKRVIGVDGTDPECDNLGTRNVCACFGS